MKFIRLLLVTVSFTAYAVWAQDTTADNTAGSMGYCYIDEIKLILTIIQTIFVVIGVVIALFALIMDHRRRKYQTTLELYNTILEEEQRLENEINDVFPKEMINPNDQRYEKDKKLQLIIKHLLTLYEQISVGINLNILDLRVFMRIAGKSSINFYERSKQVIEKVRKENGRPATYGDFEDLVNNMKEKYSSNQRKYIPKGQYK